MHYYQYFRCVFGINCVLLEKVYSINFFLKDVNMKLIVLDLQKEVYILFYLSTQNEVKS